MDNFLEHSDSIVLMKASRNTKELESAIDEKTDLKKYFQYKIVPKKMKKIVERFSTEKPYLTTTIIKFTDD